MEFSYFRVTGTMYLVPGMYLAASKSIGPIASRCMQIACCGVARPVRLVCDGPMASRLFFIRLNKGMCMGVVRVIPRGDAGRGGGGFEMAED